MDKLTKKLSPAIVENAKPEAAPYRIWDVTVPSLFLRVQPSGIKSFNLQWSRLSSRSLGKWPAITVESARTKARMMLAEVDQHGAPLAVLDAQKPNGGKALTLADYMADHYGPWVEAERRTGAETKGRILSVFAQFASRELAGITVHDLDLWKAERLKDGREPTTINRDLTALKAALSKAVEWHLIDSAPAMAVKKAKVDDDKRVRYLTEAESKRLRKALADRDARMIAARKRTIAGNRTQHEGVAAIPDDGFGDLLTPLVLTALNTGCRRGELTGLLWVDVDLKDKKQVMVRAHTSKGAKARVIPLNAEAVDVLKRWKRQNDSDRVFPIESPKKAWAALMTRAKIDDFKFHDCRHDFASRLVMAGVALAVIRDLLGHATIAMTERYAHLSGSAGAAAVALLGVKK